MLSWRRLVGRKFLLSQVVQAISQTASAQLSNRIFGEIKSIKFPLGPCGSGIFCRYDVVTGDDWELVSGIKSGITQCANGGKESDEIVFNMPIECTYKSTNIFGWPQIVFSIYGANIWGTEVNLGYARTHVPCFVTKEGKKSDFTVLTAPIIIPKATNIWSSLINFITARNPEIRDPPKILTDGTKMKNLFTSSYGEVIVSLCIITKGTDKFVFDF